MIFVSNENNLNLFKIRGMIMTKGKLFYSLTMWGKISNGPFDTDFQSSWSGLENINQQ